MSIFPKEVHIAAEYYLLFRRGCEILEQSGTNTERDRLYLDALFREMAWIRIGSVPGGQWAPPLREWTPDEQWLADETDWQYTEVFVKINEARLSVFPDKTKEQVADIVQSVCRRLYNGGHFDVADNHDADVLAFVRDVKARLAGVIPVPV